MIDLVISLELTGWSFRSQKFPWCFWSEYSHLSHLVPSQTTGLNHPFWVHFQWRNPRVSMTIPPFCWSWIKWLDSVITGWWFQRFFIFTPVWGRFPIWLILFRWVETTNWIKLFFLCSVRWTKLFGYIMILLYKFPSKKVPVSTLYP